MSTTLFLAGAAGAVGSALVPLLVDSGYTVYGTTRKAERAGEIEAMGAHAVIVDVFDSAALTREMQRIEPAIVVHQLTDLPPGLDPARMADAVMRNARIRDDGTANLVAAARAAGCRRFIAQSIAWAYAPGPTPHAETWPLDLGVDGPRAITVRGVAALEARTLDESDPRWKGTVLRYGNLYGPRTGFDEPTGASPVHVEAAAWAVVLALKSGATGVFNIADNGALASSEKAKRVLGWDPALRLAPLVESGLE